MRVSITDGLGEELLAQLKGRGTLEAEVEKRLTETLHAPGTRVVLSTDDCDEIARILCTGLPIRTKPDLLRAVSQAGAVSIGNVRLQFTPTQLQQIEERARKVGDTLDQFVGRVAAKLLTDIFLVAPGEQGVFYTPGFDPTTEIEHEDGDDGELSDADARLARGGED